MRSSWHSGARSLAALTLAVMLRLLREGLVVRALAWPGLLASLALVGTAGAYAVWGTTPTIAVGSEELLAPLRARGFDVELVEHPEARLREGLVIHAIWKEDGRWVLGRSWGGRATLEAEAALRDYAGDRWRLEIPPLEARPGDVDHQAALLAGVIGLLFTLYGVVMGAGALYRDRSTGSLESELALPVPNWMHAAARLLALLLVLGPALVISLLIVTALLAIDNVGLWMLTGTCAAVVGGTIGFALMARAVAAHGFSGPLSRALTLTMAAMALGWWQPALGRWLPLVSLGSFMAGTAPSLLIAPLALVVATVVTLDFRRRECL